MRKMSWIRSSESATLVVLFALALGLVAVGTAGALTVSDERAINESGVGERVSATVVIEDPFQDQPDAWTLQASTELRNVSWTVTVLQQGNQVNETVYGNQTIEQRLDLDNGGDEVRIKLTGDTPPVENFTYDPPQSYVLWELNAVTGSSTEDLDQKTVHHYTNASRDARSAIDDAAQTINETGASGQARTDLNQSISAFNNENWQLAKQEAQSAADQAEQAQQSQQQTQLILYGVAALVVLALVGGGIYYWRSNQDQPTKLQ
ncbi:MAG: hypothetical protein ABEJ40_01565 [Haloarculaceae archaeon]